MTSTGTLPPPAATQPSEPDNLHAREQALRHVLAGLPRLAVALSGGLDSRFLVHAALQAGCVVTALHITGPHVPPDESRQAAAWAAARGVTFEAVPANPLHLPEVAQGRRDRCYHCKRACFTLLRQRAHHLGGLPLCDGTNADDLGAYRPGLRALKELSVRSPLAEAGLGKAGIRVLAARTGMDRPDQCARPCLLTRLAYDMPPDAHTLARIAGAERDLEHLGLRDFRLRLAPKEPPRLQIGPMEPPRLGIGDDPARLRIGDAPRQFRMDDAPPQACGNARPTGISACGPTGRANPYPAVNPAPEENPVSERITDALLLRVLERHGFGAAVIDRAGPVSGFFDR